MVFLPKLSILIITIYIIPSLCYDVLFFSVIVIKLVIHIGYSKNNVLNTNAARSYNNVLLYTHSSCWRPPIILLYCIAIHYYYYYCSNMVFETEIINIFKKTSIETTVLIIFHFNRSQQ